MWLILLGFVLVLVALWGRLVDRQHRKTWGVKPAPEAEVWLGQQRDSGPI